MVETRLGVFGGRPPRYAAWPREADHTALSLYISRANPLGSMDEVLEGSFWGESLFGDASSGLITRREILPGGGDSLVATVGMWKLQG